MGDQQGQRRGRNSIDPAGLADGLRPKLLKLLSDFVRQAGEGGIVKRIRQFEAFVAAVGLDAGPALAPAGVLLLLLDVVEGLAPP